MASNSIAAEGHIFEQPEGAHPILEIVVAQAHVGVADPCADLAAVTNLSGCTHKKHPIGLPGRYETDVPPQSFGS